MLVPVLRTAAFLLACGLLLLAPASSRAQSIEDIEFEYGLKGGLAFSDLQTDQTSGAGRRRAFSGGVFGSVGLAGSFALQAEALYVQKGDKQEFSQDGGIETAVIRLNYVEVPLLFRLEAPLLGQASMFPYMGPIFSFEVNEDTGDLVQFPEDQDQLERLIRDLLQETSLAQNSDFSFSVGVEFNIEGPTFDILLDVRFTRTMGDIGAEVLSREQIEEERKERFPPGEFPPGEYPPERLQLPDLPTQGIGLSSAQNSTISVMAGVRF